MAPQRVWSKKLGRNTKMGVTQALGSIAFCIVLFSQLGAAGGLTVDGGRGEAQSLSVLERDTLHQSDPDCKYPPCD